MIDSGGTRNFQNLGLGLIYLNNDLSTNYEVLIKTFHKHLGKTEGKEQALTIFPYFYTD
jgi:hypothetical protein